MFVTLYLKKRTQSLAIHCARDFFDKIYIFWCHFPWERHGQYDIEINVSHNNCEEITNLYGLHYGTRFIQIANIWSTSHKNANCKEYMWHSICLIHGYLNVRHIDSVLLQSFCCCWKHEHFMCVSKITID